MPMIERDASLNHLTDYSSTVPGLSFFLLPFLSIFLFSPFFSCQLPEQLPSPRLYCMTFYLHSSRTPRTVSRPPCLLPLATWHLPLGVCRLLFAAWCLPLAASHVSLAACRLPLGACRLVLAAWCLNPGSPLVRCAFSACTMYIVYWNSYAV